MVPAGKKAIHSLFDALGKLGAFYQLKLFRIKKKKEMGEMNFNNIFI